MQYELKKQHRYEYGHDMDLDSTLTQTRIGHQTQQETEMFVFRRYEPTTYEATPYSVCYGSSLVLPHLL